MNIRSWGLFCAGVLMAGPSGSAAAQAAGNVYQQGPAPDHLVVVEAEKFGANAPSGTHTWNMVTSPAGSAGAGAMKAMPDTATSIDTGYAAASPRLDFAVNFTQTGTHYIWIRGYGQGGQADSCHAGIDGTAPASAQAIATFGTSYQWRRKMIHLTGDANVNVPSAGVHRINLWMREDAFVVDRVLITTNPSYAGLTDGGTMEGPPESAQGAAPGSTPPPPVVPPPPAVPRTIDHDEGLVGDRCAMGAAVPAAGGWAAFWLMALLLGIRRVTSR